MLRRRTGITAEGRELYRFINSLHAEGIACFGQSCRQDVFSGEVYSRDLKKVRRLAEKYGIELVETERRSVAAFLGRYRKRYGIAVGAAAAFIGCLYFSQVVVTIEIQGNQRLSESDILSSLARLDIKKGAPIRDLDLHYCENELEIMNDDIAWAGIRRTGNRIVVQVKETVEKPEMLHERIPCNIVSAKDAVITSMSVYSGMPVHDVGDFVPVGALIISGISENDTGRMSLHHAAGKVTGVYEETAEFTEKYCPGIRVETGNVRKERRLRLFSLDIPITPVRNSFESCERETKVKQLRLFGKELPLGIVTDTLRETVVNTERYPDEKLDRMLAERMYLYEKNFLSGCKIIKRDVKRVRNGDSITFRAVYRLEGEIGRQKEIFIK